MKTAKRADIVLCFVTPEIANKTVEMRIKKPLFHFRIIGHELIGHQPDEIIRCIAQTAMFPIEPEHPAISANRGVSGPGVPFQKHFGNNVQRI